MHVRKGDDVLVLAGKDRGRTGEVLELDHERGRVKIEGCNIIVKHERPNPVTGEKGQRVEREGWIDASNVSLYAESGDGDEFERQPVRVGYKFVGADGELYEDKPAARESFEGESPDVIHKVRIGRQTGDVVDEVPSYD
jgi:large subunit ribosomal protein L24